MPDHPEKLEIPKDPVIEAFKKDIDRTLFERTLRMTVQERLENLQAFIDWVAEVRRSQPA